MPTITVNVPQELKKRMDERKITNWSAVARTAFEQRLQEESMLTMIREATKNSTMTEEDALRMGRAVNKKVAKKYLAALEKYNRKTSDKKG